jgi:hypothetical protein
VCYFRQAVRRIVGSIMGQIPLPLYFFAVVFDGSRLAVVGVHIFLKAGELLLRRVVADEHEVRVFVLRWDIIAAAVVIAAGLLCLGGVGRMVCAALLIAVVAVAIVVLIALVVLLGQVTDGASTVGGSATALGVRNLVVEVPTKQTMDDTARNELRDTLSASGVEHAVFWDDAAGIFQ